MKIGPPLVAFLLVAIGYLGARAYIFDERDEPFGPYTVSIERQYTNETGRELIFRTENLSCPDGLWYVDSFDRVLIADCVTGEAVAYYSSFVESLRQDPSPYGITFLSASLGYKAQVATITLPTNLTESDETNNTRPLLENRTVFQVTLSLSFSDYCGPLCAMGFSHQRVATFSLEGELMAVEGDDEMPPVWVS